MRVSHASQKRCFLHQNYQALAPKKKLAVVPCVITWCASVSTGLRFFTLVSATWWKRINKDYGPSGVQLFLTLCHNSFPVQLITVWKTD